MIPEEETTALTNQEILSIFGISFANSVWKCRQDPTPLGHGVGSLGWDLCSFHWTLQLTESCVWGSITFCPWFSSHLYLFLPHTRNIFRSYFQASWTWNALHPTSSFSLLSKTKHTKEGTATSECTHMYYLFLENCQLITPKAQHNLSECLFGTLF